MNFKSTKLNQFLFTASSLFLGLMAMAQDSDNMVDNPSFENAQVKKIRKLGDIERADNWTSATKARADLFSSNANIPEVQVPNNIYGSEEAKDGTNYAGIIAYSYKEKESRTYLQTQLKYPMKKGMRYKVSFNASLAELSKYTTNRLGAYLSKKAIGSDDKVPAIITDKTHIEHPDKVVFTGMYGWDLVCGEYTAEGGEKFLTIGNFSNEGDMKVERVRKPRDVKGQQIIAAYFYIDNISITLLNPDEECDCGYSDEFEFETLTLYQRAPQIDLSMTPAEKLEQHNIYYASGRYDVRIDGQRTIDAVYQIMKENPSMKIQITGYTDANEADSRENAITSLRRAEYIKALLEDKGIDGKRIIAMDGQNSKDSKYIEENDDDNLRAAKNRRVSFRAL